MFGSFIDLVSNVARVVVAPVDLVLTTANAIVEPVADVATDLTNDIKSIFK
jgi:hypothetical protein